MTDVRSACDLLLTEKAILVHIKAGGDLDSTIGTELASANIFCFHQRGVHNRANPVADIFRLNNFIDIQGAIAIEVQARG